MRVSQAKSREAAGGLSLAAGLLTGLIVVPKLLFQAGMDFTAAYMAMGAMTVLASVWLAFRELPVIAMPSVSMAAWLAYVVIISKGCSWQEVMGLSAAVSLAGSLLFRLSEGRGLSEAVPLWLRKFLVIGLGMMLIMQGLVQVILAAKRYVYIETPYFLPTEPVLFALKTAALGGADVRLMVPYRSDAKFVEWASRSYLREMVNTGVKVSLYQAGFLHSKMVVSDDAICTCGSTNVDFRSFENNFEANIFIYDQGVAAQMRDMFLLDEKQTVLFSDIPKRIRPSFMKRLGESVVRLLSPVM